LWTVWQFFTGTFLQNVHGSCLHCWLGTFLHFCVGTFTHFSSGTLVQDVLGTNRSDCFTISSHFSYGLVLQVSGMITQTLAFPSPSHLDSQSSLYKVWHCVSVKGSETVSKYSLQTFLSKVLHSLASTTLHSSVMVDTHSSVYSVVQLLTSSVLHSWDSVST